MNGFHGLFQYAFYNAVCGAALFLFIFVLSQQPLKLFFVTGALQALSAAFPSFCQGFGFFLFRVDEPAYKADHAKNKKHDQDCDQDTGYGNMFVWPLGLLCVEAVARGASAFAVSKAVVAASAAESFPSIVTPSFASRYAVPIVRSL